MKKRCLLFFKDKRGSSTSIGMMVTLLVFSVLALVAFNVAQGINTTMQLQAFADQLAVKVGEVGKCVDIEIDEKYAKLEAATGLSPSVEITADSYVNQARKTVQYGGAITIRLTLDVKKIGVGPFSIPIKKPFTALKITQSEQYWK